MKWLLGLAILLAAACGSSSSSTDAPAATCGGSGPLATSLDGVGANGTPTKVSLSATPCDRPLVVRVGASFCGTCRAAVAEPVTGDVRLVEVIVRDEDGADPTTDAAKRWQALAPVKGEVALDPSLTLVAQGRRLPRVLVIDPRTMTARADLDDPAPEELDGAIASLAADLAGKPPPATKPIARSDGRFTSTQQKMLAGMVLAGKAPPPDPTNRVADSVRAANLGQQLFDDPLLSPSGQTSCARCHERDRAFTDAAETATGGAEGGVRNTPSIVLAAWSRWQLWDGRADSLWMQATFPLEDPTEFATTRLFVAHRVFEAYREPYEDLFGALPALDDAARFPATGKPGDDAWEAMPASDQDAITGVFVNVAKSIGAFERGFRVSPNPLDRYAGGELGALTDKEKDGLRAFFETGCAQCHWGGRLTDDAFHPLRFPSGHHDFTADDGRSAGIPQYEASDFRADGRFSDAKQPRRVIAKAKRDLGSFKTPALRGVAVTAPYGHGGNVPTLAMAVDLHRTLGRPAGDKLSSGAVEPWLVAFDASRSPALVAFLETLGFLF